MCHCPTGVHPPHNQRHTINWLALPGFRFFFQLAPMYLITKFFFLLQHKTFPARGETRTHIYPLGVHSARRSVRTKINSVRGPWRAPHTDWILRVAGTDRHREFFGLPRENSLADESENEFLTDRGRSGDSFPCGCWLLEKDEAFPCSDFVLLTCSKNMLQNLSACDV